MAFAKIDGRDVTVGPAATVIEACEAEGIPVPALCRVPGLPPYNSCMVCLVEREDSGELVPACSHPAAGGAFRTDSARAKRARKAAIELLLSEHLGDCEAPCTRACPAHMDIPRVIKHIEKKEYAAALAAVRERIALPEVTGWICPAPCEKACRRGSYDGPLAICLLERFAAEAGAAAAEVVAPPAVGAPSGRRVAVVGAGPAGLSAASVLAGLGYECVLLDRESAPGGALRTQVERLPQAALERDVARILSLGVRFEPGVEIGTDAALAGLAARHDGVVLATGPATAREKVPPNVIPCGNVSLRNPARLAVRALAYGRAAALALDALLTGGNGRRPQAARFDSRMRRLSGADLDGFVATSGACARSEPAGYDLAAGLTLEDAARESRRCLGCDCVAKESCLLRRFADETGADAGRYRGEDLRAFRRVSEPDGLVYEEGKCVRCGNCVRVAERLGAPLGLGFAGRGYGMRVKPPFAEGLGRSLGAAADACVRACPTGALARRDPRT